MKSPVLARACVLAVILGIAAALVAAESDSPLTAGILVLLGAMTVGGLAPARWWWVGVIVGAGVSASRWFAPAGATGSWMAAEGPNSPLADWASLLAPMLVALAAAGLGASLQRFAGFPGGEH